MSGVFPRIFWSLALAIALGLAIWRSSGQEHAPAVQISQRRGRYQPYLNAWLLPLYLAFLMLVGSLFLGADGAFRLCAGMCACVFFHMAVYDLVLLFLLPLLRRWLSARTCAVLWLLPNYLYLTQNSIFLPDRPLWVIRVPGGLFRWAALIWAAGACTVLLWRILSHLCFRRRVLGQASYVSDLAALDVWREEVARAGGKAPTRGPMYSPAVRTPLSIGFSRSAVRVVLPEREYAPEQLALIFRHELVHIGRQDCWAKFFLTFCTAMCWFNPLMWLAMRRSADDLELSCDETVLEDASEEERRQYADLLLRTAGDERGFTTCLSASARALRYRLKHVIAPRERALGHVAAGVIFFVLLLTGGYTALAVGGVTGRDAIFSGGTAGYAVNSIYYEDFKGGWSQAEYTCADPEALLDYLSGLELSQVLGFYSFPAGDRSFTATLSGPGAHLYLTLQEDVLEVIPLYASGQARYYRYDSAVDWPLLTSLLAPLPDEESELP